MFHAQIGGDDESERRLVSLEALEGVRQVWLIDDALTQIGRASCRERV